MILDRPWPEDLDPAEAGFEAWTETVLRRHGYFVDSPTGSGRTTYGDGTPASPICSPSRRHRRGDRQLDTDEALFGDGMFSLTGTVGDEVVVAVVSSDRERWEMGEDPLDLPQTEIWVGAPTS